MNLIFKSFTTLRHTAKVLEVWLHGMWASAKKKKMYKKFTVLQVARLKPQGHTVNWITEVTQDKNNPFQNCTDYIKFNQYMEQE